MFGTLDVSSVLKNTEKPPYDVNDTGAATRALPVELAEGLPLHRVGEIVVAHGQDIRAKFQTLDQFGSKLHGHCGILPLHRKEN